MVRPSFAQEPPFPAPIHGRGPDFDPTTFREGEYLAQPRTLLEALQASVDAGVPPTMFNPPQLPRETVTELVAFETEDEGERGVLTSPTLVALASHPFSALIGGAGTGKSFLLRQWLREAHLGTIALCSTTGIAAVNLGEGTTINALLRYFDTENLTELYTAGQLTMRLKKLRRGGLERIVIDEVSMLPADQLTVLVRAVDEANGEGYDLGDLAEADQDLPPLGLTVVGDWGQLPPVKASFAFESPEWERFHVEKLTKVWRQSDPTFVEALNAARRGDGRKAAEVLAGCFVSGTDPHFKGPTLLATNDAVERYNRLRMDTLTTPIREFTAARWGEQRPEWKKNIPETLVLKEGCLVMVLANSYDQDESRYRYVNGDLGTFVKLEQGEALVHLQRTDRHEIVKLITREVKEPLEVGERKQLKAEGHDDRIDGKQKIIGAITYLPLRVSYATTVHKGQGLTFDACQVNLREHFMSSPGICYVALSRARSSEGLRIIGTPAGLIARCSADPKVLAWL